MTRIMTTPYGAEVTSPYWIPNLDGFGYLLTVVQHPYGEGAQVDRDHVSDPEATGISPGALSRGLDSGEGSTITFIRSDPVSSQP